MGLFRKALLARLFGNDKARMNINARFVVLPKGIAAKKILITRARV